MRDVQARSTILDRQQKKDLPYGQYRKIFLFFNEFVMGRPTERGSRELYNSKYSIEYLLLYILDLELDKISHKAQRSKKNDDRDTSIDEY